MNELGGLKEGFFAARFLCSFLLAIVAAIFKSFELILLNFIHASFNNFLNLHVIQNPLWSYVD